MMDFNEFKERVAKSHWGEPKSSDEYRSIRIQLNHFVKHIKENQRQL